MAQRKNKPARLEKLITPLHRDINNSQDDEPTFISIINLEANDKI